MATFQSKINLRNIFLVLAGIFFLLFVYRLWAGFSKNAAFGEGLNMGGGQSFFDGQIGLRKNYASEKKMGATAPSFPADVNQKYEKTASLAARSNDFEPDEARARDRARAFGATVQYENKSGNIGARQLHLMIGVKPELFDSFYVEIQKIGKVYQNSVTKVDKTTEFRELNGKKASLEKALSNLNELKNRAGTISDLISLHEKILDVERQMQELGVDLGNFSAENEFCTVRFSINERGGERTVSMAWRIEVAFKWAVEKFFFLMAGLVGLALAAWLFSVVLKKLNPAE